MQAESSFVWCLNGCLNLKYTKEPLVAGVKIIYFLGVILPNSMVIYYVKAAPSDGEKGLSSNPVDAADFYLLCGRYFHFTILLSPVFLGGGGGYPTRSPVEFTPATIHLTLPPGCGAAKTSLYASSYFIPHFKLSISFLSRVSFFPPFCIFYFTLTR